MFKSIESGNSVSVNQKVKVQASVHCNLITVKATSQCGIVNFEKGKIDPALKDS